MSGILKDIKPYLIHVLFNATALRFQPHEYTVLISDSNKHTKDHLLAHRTFVLHADIGDIKMFVIITCRKHMHAEYMDNISIKLG